MALCSTSIGSSTKGSKNRLTMGCATITQQQITTHNKPQHLSLDCVRLIDCLLVVPILSRKESATLSPVATAYDVTALTTHTNNTSQDKRQHTTNDIG